MKKNISKIFLALFLLQGFISVDCFCACAQDSLLIPNKIEEKAVKQNGLNYFNLANIVDNFFNSNIKDSSQVFDNQAEIRKEFLAVTSKFNQANALVAYGEYQELIKKIEDDISLLSLAKILYEIGYFTLANEAIEKIIYKNQYYENILDLEKIYKTKILLTKDEEIRYAKLYSNIYFNNSAQEAEIDLLTEKNKNKALFNKNDYANYLLAISNFEQKKYSHAINAINKAIAINPLNYNYKILKINILSAQKKYKEALALIEKLENNFLPLTLVDILENKKVSLLAQISKNEKDKKYYAVKKSYLAGDFEKAKKDCLNILNFDKDNDKIIALCAKSELALGNIERANMYFVNAYKINKNNLETKIGLADIRYLHGDYKNAVKMYKKALNSDKKNYEVLIKLFCAQKEWGKSQKELKKIQLMLDKIPRVAYNSYYFCAISIAQKNVALKEEFLKTALNYNPNCIISIAELVALQLKNKNIAIAKGLIHQASFTLEKNYFYYYLCGLYNQAINDKQEAVKYFKTSINLNSGFEIANKKLLELIPNIQSEEI